MISFLRFREIGAIGVEPVCPDVCARFRVDQLHIHADLVAAAPHAALEHIADAELATDLLRIDRFALVGEGGVARDHEAAGNALEIGRQIIGDPVGKIFLVRIVRQVRERQDDDRQARRRLYWSLQGWRVRGRGRRRSAVGEAEIPLFRRKIPLFGQVTKFVRK